MRTLVGVALVIVCLGLAGCSLFGKKQAARNTNPKPFVGSETPAKTETVAIPRSSDGPLPKANGMIAGLVLAKDTGRPVSNAWIRVKDPEDEGESKAAPWDVETTPEGYFTIPGLKVGRYYKLIARAKEGDKLIGQVAYVQPPKVSLLFQLGDPGRSEKLPPIPDAPTVPEKKAAQDSEDSKERTPAASMGKPIKLPDDDAPPRANLAAPSPATGSGAPPDGGAAPDPANIAHDDFQRVPPAPRAEIPPWQPPPVPGEPQWERAPEERRPRTTPVPPQPPGSVRLPIIPTPVPSCGLYGNKLDNFALYDLNGRVWEYKRDHRGRLILLDFWYHNCQPCLRAIPKLVELQRDYGSDGLEVVGIACETGSVEEQRRNVRPIHGRYNINYTTLLSGGGPGRCPVMEQFQVTYFPLLVLIDADGRIIWRSTREGMDDYEHYKLRKIIHDRLVTKAPPP
ncbi:MAG TPA: thioredoxin-like domain-containing protein [Gemmataceae bacterium]|nr:thioredoxin-like domain-containing protein [Gemmataceae bacterium]